jgi:Domain of unknown function (DUF4388)
MELEGQLQLQALDMACQSLAQRAKLLARAGSVAKSSRLKKIDRMVADAIWRIEKEIMGSSSGLSAADETKDLGVLERLLKGKDVAGESDPSRAEAQSKPPSEKHSLSLRGEGMCVPPPDLLGFLSSQRLTGILEVTTSTETFTIELEAGDIVHAHVRPTLPEQRLGVLERVRGEFPADRVGEALLRRRLVTREGLLGALRTQIQLLFNRLFNAEIRRFTFWSGRPLHADDGMRLQAMALILEGARTFDEDRAGG